MLTFLELYSHHEEHEGEHEARVGGVAEHFTEPGGEVRLQSLLDDVKHTSLPTASEERQDSSTTADNPNPNP